jgi:predicted ferric reductase
MNWSPVHALRIHIWAGYVSFFLIFLHAIMIVGVWFKWAPGAIYEEFIPPKECWSGMYPKESRCKWQFYNFTGTIAMIFFTIIWLSSFHWFRRKWYRLFYIIHVVFGTLTLLASIWHDESIALYLLPSILYYLASTMPTLVQALASRFRGGVKILQVVVLDDANDCLEVRVSIDPTALAVLSSTHPSKYIKLCAPNISMVWHPFTVYNHPNDPTTLRMMFRPIGPFTKALRSSLVNLDKRPITLIDGFYRGSDHCQQAMMCHDHVSLVAGGVAMTPFISMIFAVLKELSSMNLSPSDNSMSEQDQPILRSLTLIWSCRELGLLSFVKTQYLDDMTCLASNIKGFEFKIKVYYTGTSKLYTPLAKTIQSQIGSVCGTDYGTKCYDVDEEVFTESQSDSSSEVGQATRNTPDLVDNDVTKIEGWKSLVHETLTFQHGSGNVGKSSSGHAMELARMMPARFSRMIWNLPYFLAFTGSVWLGFHFMFFPFDNANSYLDKSEHTYITMLVVAFFFAVGCIIENCVLLLRKHWPAPRYDDFDLVSTKQISSKEEQFVTGDIETIAVTSTMIQFYVERPSADDMLADAKLATAPGIFVCGPVGMVQLLRAAASGENSSFGLLTRYAIYEESFEM